MDISSISVIMVIVVRSCVIIDPRLARAELGGGQSPTYPDREKEVGEFSSLRSSGWIDKQKRGEKVGEEGSFFLPSEIYDETHSLASSSSYSFFLSFFSPLSISRMIRIITRR